VTLTQLSAAVAHQVAPAMNRKQRRAAGKEGRPAPPPAAADLISLLDNARRKEERACPDDEIIAAYVKAAVSFPAHAEALYGAARFCRTKGLHERGYQFAKQGLEIPCPHAGPLAARWIYEHGLLDELAVSSYRTDRHTECVDACDRLLNGGKLPAHDRDRVLKNKLLAIDKLREAAARLRFRPSIKSIHSRGAIFYVAEQDQLAQRIAHTGVWEPHLYDFAEQILKANSNVIDLGANFGYHTVGLARMIPDGQVFAFEPLSFCFSQLQMNVLANSLRNVTTFKMAVTDKTGALIEMDPLEATMNAQGMVNIGNTAIGSGGDFTFAVRLDDMNLPKIDFLKVDIQGAELAALTGMSKLISKDRPAFFIEIEEHHLQRYGTSSKAVIEHFMALDYSLLRIRTDWPTDHLALPNERADLLSRCRAQQKYQTDLLSGSKIELIFDNPYFYAGFITS
jgi:FkbM family methyltransferase